MKHYRSTLITGGAGFIGSKLGAALVPFTDHVTVFDNLLPQVHGSDAVAPANRPGYDFELGDIRDRQAIAGCVSRCEPDLIVHLAADTGTGQSFDEVGRYCAVNVQGTAYLVEALRNRATDQPYRVILASSRAIYGEGAYLDGEGSIFVPPPRNAEDMRNGVFTLNDAAGRTATPVATAEDIALNPASIYASTKLMQEYILAQSLTGTAAELVILRLQNVYGPGQSLRNPYTGVLSIFSQQILDGKLPLNIYEDGDIVRDFIFIDDVVRAFVAAATVDRPPAQPANIGSAEGVTILEAAQTLLEYFGRDPEAVRISGQFRTGDIRHARADIERARTLLGWSPQIDIREGLARLVRSIAQAHEPSR